MFIEIMKMTNQFYQCPLAEHTQNALVEIQAVDWR